MHEPMVQRAGFDLIVWLIVVGFTLVSQMAKAAKQKPRQRPPPAPGRAETLASRPAALGTPATRMPQAPTKPRQPARPMRVRPAVVIPEEAEPARRMDLQSVLEELARRQQTAELPEQNVSEPPELAVDPLFGVDPDAVVQPPPPPVRLQPATVRLPPQTMSVMAHAPILESKVDPYAVGRRTAAEVALLNLGRALRDDMQKHVSLRKAVLLRELLDPPLALRPAGRGGI